MTINVKMVATGPDDKSVIAKVAVQTVDEDGNVVRTEPPVTLDDGQEHEFVLFEGQELRVYEKPA